MSDTCYPNGFCMIDNRVPDQQLAAMGGPGTKLYLLLARMAGRDGTCFPSIRTLCARAGIARNTCRKYLRRLAGLGLVEIEPRTNPAGDATSNRYHLAGVGQAEKGGGSGPDTTVGQTGERGVGHALAPNKTQSEGHLLKPDSPEGARARARDGNLWKGVVREGKGKKTALPLEVELEQIVASITAWSKKDHGPEGPGIFAAIGY